MYIDEDYEYVDALEGAQNIRYKHTKRRLPGCLIIGVRKGGTRALLEFLNLHPSIQAEKREMHFFDDDDNYNKGLDWYRKRMPFSFSDQITVEKTPAYFVEESVPERAYKMNSTLKLVIVMRDPVERAISDYTQVQSTRIEKGKPYDSFRDLAVDPETGEVNKSYKAIRRSVYHRHMERWLKWFPLSQFHFVSGENLVKNPTEELEKVEKFLGLEHKLTKDHFYFNETRGFYCMHLKQKEKCLAKSKGRQHPFVDEETVQKLRDFFRPHNEKFYQLVGINFGWQWNIFTGVSCSPAGVFVVDDCSRAVHLPLLLTGQLYMYVCMFLKFLDVFNPLILSQTNNCVVIIMLHCWDSRSKDESLSTAWIRSTFKTLVYGLNLLVVRFLTDFSCSYFFYIKLCMNSQITSQSGIYYNNYESLW